MNLIFAYLRSVLWKTEQESEWKFNFCMLQRLVFSKWTNKTMSACKNNCFSKVSSVSSEEIVFTCQSVELSPAGHSSVKCEDLQRDGVLSFQVWLHFNTPVFIIPHTRMLNNSGSSVFLFCFFLRNTASMNICPRQIVFFIDQSHSPPCERSPACRLRQSSFLELQTHTHTHPERLIVLGYWSVFASSADAEPSTWWMATILWE